MAGLFLSCPVIFPCQGKLKPVACFAVAANVRGGQGPTNCYPESAREPRNMGGTADFEKVGKLQQYTTLNFDGLQNPFMVILGMVYYCSTNITLLLWPEKRWGFAWLFYAFLGFLAWLCVPSLVSAFCV